MNIYPINLNTGKGQNIKTYKRGIYTKNPAFPVVLKCDTVSFSGAAPHSEILKRLLAHEIPDLYSSVILINPRDVEKMMEHRVFSRSIQSIARILKPYEKSMFPVEKQVYRMMKKVSKRNPNIRLDAFMHRLVPHHSKILINQQRPVFEKLSKLAVKMPPEQIKQYNALVKITNEKLADKPVIIPFSKKEFIYKLTRIKERIQKSGKYKDKWAMNKILNFSNAIPDKVKETSSYKDSNKLISNFLRVSDFFEKSSLKNDKDMIELFEISKSKIYRIPTNIKFNRKSFIYDLKKITDQLEDKKLAHQIIQTALKLPTSKNSISAFIIKSADRSAQQIGYDLIWGAIGSADHLLASKMGGADDISNYGLASMRLNSEKAHKKLSLVLKENPEIRTYCQKHVDRLIELANSGIFQKIGLSKSYILSLVNKLYKLSSDDAPLIIDTSKLK